jgi:hypothetical protein
MKLSTNEHQRRSQARKSKHILQGVGGTPTSGGSLSPPLPCPAPRPTCPSVGLGHSDPGAMSECACNIVHATCLVLPRCYLLPFSIAAAHHHCMIQLCNTDCLVTPEDSARQHTVDTCDMPEGVDYQAIANTLRPDRPWVAGTAPPRRTSSHKSSPCVGYQSDGVVDFEAEVRTFTKLSGTPGHRPAASRGQSDLIDLHDDCEGPQSDTDDEQQDARQPVTKELSGPAAHPSPVSINQHVDPSQPDAHMRTPPSSVLSKQPSTTKGPSRAERALQPASSRACHTSEGGTKLPASRTTSKRTATTSTTEVQPVERHSACLVERVRLADHESTRARVLTALDL